VAHAPEAEAATLKVVHASPLARLSDIFARAIRALSPRPSARVAAREPPLSAAGLLAWAPSEEAPLAPHLLLGLSPAYLRTFCEVNGIRSTDATQRIAELMIRRTARSRQSHAEDLAKVDTLTSTGRPAVGPATLFVAHHHGSSFIHMLDAVDAHLERAGADPLNTYLWLSVVCCRHHRIPEEVAQVGRVQRAIGATALVLDPPDAPACLTRLWCLFEVATAELGGVPISLAFAQRPFAPGSEVALVDDEGDKAARTPRALPSARRRAFIAELGNLDARSAVTSEGKDRAAIDGRIRRAFGAEDPEDAYERFDDLLRFALERAAGSASCAPSRPPRLPDATSAPMLERGAARSTLPSCRPQRVGRSSRRRWRVRRSRSSGGPPKSLAARPRARQSRAAATAACPAARARRTAANRRAPGSSRCHRRRRWAGRRAA